MTPPYAARVTLRGCSTQPTPLTLGTWGVMTDAYQDVLTDEAFQSLVVEAYRLGLRSFDLAFLWDGERAMRLVAEALGPDIASCFFFLRAGRTTTGNPDKPIAVDFGLTALRPQVERALELLGVAKVDMLLLHAPPRTLVERGETMQGLDVLRSEGLVGAIGLSTTSGAVALTALEQGFACAAMPYNALVTHAVRELDEGFPVVDGEEARCVLAHSSLLHGVLAARVPAGHQYPPGDHRRERWTEQALRTRLYHARALAPLANRHTDDTRKVETHVPNLAALALRFALSHPRVGSVAIGPRDVKHLALLVEGVSKADPLSLNAATLREIETLLASAGA
ncbi:MAG: aldo/keto reductase [Sandaracinaceae bacterium]|nr:aldo/keto reductase [Sandaracinaceae bacterium]